MVVCMGFFMIKMMSASVVFFMAGHVFADAGHFMPESHAPAGVMNEHTHKTGEVMLGYRQMYQKFDDYYAGSQKISVSDLAAADYTSYASQMHMHMFMLDIMYAPTDQLTLMLMPQYMRMSMTMASVDAHAQENEHSHHLHHGKEHASHSGNHVVEGLSDTVISASYAFNQESANGWIATMGLSAPTGSVDQKNSDGTFTHYGMQLGSGTWDLLSSLTYREFIGQISWGAQVYSTTRLESKNKSGFAFGNKHGATSWAAYRLNPNLSSSVRLAYDKEEGIEGHYNGPHNHSSPMDLQKNYGGERVDLGLGFNWVSQSGFRAGLEWLEPIDQNYKGQQLGRDRSLSLSLSYAFK